MNKSQQSSDYLVEQSLHLALSLIVGNWKYIEPSTKAKLNKDPNTELGNDPKPRFYNLADNPGETKDLAEVYHERVAEMKLKFGNIK